LISLFQVPSFVLAFSLFIPLLARIKTPHERLYRILFFIPVFYLFWLNISLSYLDGGFFSEEIELFTSRSYAWLRVLLLSLTFITITRLAFSMQSWDLVRAFSKKWSFFEKFIFCAIPLYVITLFFNLPCFPCVINRTIFYQSENFIFFLLKYIDLISLLIGYFIALVIGDTAKKVERLYLIISIIVLFATFITLGHKFSQFVHFIYIFLIGFSLKVIWFKRFLHLFVLLVVLFLVTFLLYKIKSDLFFLDFVDIISKRIFIYQGQFAWLIDSYWIKSNSQVNLISFRDFVINAIDYNNITIKYLMNTTLGISKSALKLNSGFTLSGVFPSVFLVLSKYILVCILAMVIYSVIFSFFLLRLIYEIRNRRLFFVILLFFVFYPWMTFFFNADISAFLGTNYYLKLISCLAVHFFIIITKKINN
jgi:hypothetical protein